MDIVIYYFSFWGRVLRKSFKTWNTDAWARAIESLKVGDAASKTWQDLGGIKGALSHFMHPNLGYALLPSLGGYSFFGLRESLEPDCLEMRADRNLWHLFNPEKLVVEIFPDDPLQSFLLMDLKPIDIKDLGNRDGVEHALESGRQAVVRVPEGDYLPQDLRFESRNFTGHGSAFKIPVGSALIVRWLRGRLLLVAKSSIWNGISQSDGGMHGSLDSNQIRKIIISLKSEGADRNV